MKLSVNAVAKLPMYLLRLILLQTEIINGGRKEKELNMTGDKMTHDEKAKRRGDILAWNTALSNFADPKCSKKGCYGRGYVARQPDGELVPCKCALAKMDKEVKYYEYKDTLEKKTTYTIVPDRQTNEKGDVPKESNQSIPES